MTFWSGETISQRIKTVVDKPDLECIDCAAYTLKVGSEYYVTPTDRTVDPRSKSIKKLGEGEAFAIPPGQFAYVMTEEIITIPENVLAFISVRARIKWKGLVNVSGFHVDPGFSGRLMYSVFNAGPAPIHLRQGDPAFLIWFADLDDNANEKYSKQMDKPVSRMDVGILNHISGELHSLEGLAEKIRTTEKELREKIHALERTNGVIAVAAGAVLTIATFIVGRWVLDTYIDPPRVQIEVPAVSSNESTDGR